MTLLAGAFSRRGRLQNSDVLFESMSQLISRNADDQLHARQNAIRDERAIVMKVDIGAFGVPARVDDGNCATLVAGQPLIVPADGSDRDRMSDTVALHADFTNTQSSSFESARGQFSAVHYDRVGKRLVLATDKLGIRALYWWSDGDLVLFSSTLRVFEDLHAATKRIDNRGLAEVLAFGYALGPRTPYAPISMLEAAQMIEFTDQNVASSRYWRWEDIKQSSESAATLSKRTHEVFLESVRLRLGGDRATTAFLSGGMDTRSVVGALRSLDVEVHSVNLAWPGTQDRVYGAELAKKAGTVHEEPPLVMDEGPAFIASLAKLCQTSTAPIRSRIERPQMMWAGDGGSIGLGHIHLTPRIVELCNAGNLAGVVSEFLRSEQITVPSRILQSAVLSEMSDAPRRGLTDELERLKPGGLLQGLWFYLLQNDQRRGQQPHCEHIDRHRLEANVPFLDSEFLAMVATIPIELRLYHAFYNTWLKHFPEYIANTPWQAYTGHVPCPVPVAAQLPNQWDSSTLSAKRQHARRTLVRRVRKMMMSPRFASPLMKRSALAMATLAHMTGVRNYDYLLTAARKIQRHWNVVIAR